MNFSLFLHGKRVSRAEEIAQNFDIPSLKGYLYGGILPRFLRDTGCVELYWKCGEMFGDYTRKNTDSNTEELLYELFNMPYTPQKKTGTPLVSTSDTDTPRDFWQFFHHNGSYKFPDLDVLANLFAKHPHHEQDPLVPSEPFGFDFSDAGLWRKVLERLSLPGANFWQFEDILFPKPKPTAIAAPSSFNTAHDIGMESGSLNFGGLENFGSFNLGGLESLGSFSLGGLENLGSFNLGGLENFGSFNFGSFGSFSLEQLLYLYIEELGGQTGSFNYGSNITNNRIINSFSGSYSIWGSQVHYQNNERQIGENSGSLGSFGSFGSFNLEQTGSFNYERSSISQRSFAGYTDNSSSYSLNHLGSFSVHQIGELESSFTIKNENAGSFTNNISSYNIKIENANSFMNITGSRSPESVNESGGSHPLSYTSFATDSSFGGSASFVPLSKEQEHLQAHEQEQQSRMFHIKNQIEKDRLNRFGYGIDLI